MKNIRRIPSYLVPSRSIETEGIKITRDAPVTVFDDWNRPHWSASLIIEEDGYNGKIDKWIYFHSLLADSRLPLYSFQAYGHNCGDFRIEELNSKSYSHVAAREMQLDFNNVLPGIYRKSDIK